MTRRSVDQVLAAWRNSRQKAVVIVIPVEEAPFLAAMYRHLGGVEIENNLLGWPAE